MSDNAWNRAYDDNGNEYFYQDNTGISSWTLPPDAELNDPYPSMKLKEPRLQDDSHDYINGVYGYESEEGEGEEEEEGDVSSPVQRRDIEPPADDAKGSPYRDSYINLKALTSPGKHQKQRGTPSKQQRSTPSKQQLLTQANNAQARAAFGGGTSSVNELLETDVDRQLRKIQKMKDDGGHVLRSAGRWSEWEAVNGAIFYVYNNQYGGQWDKPKVFELEDSNNVSNIGSGAAPLGNKRSTSGATKRQHDIVTLATKADEFSRTGGGLQSPGGRDHLQSYPAFGKSFIPEQSPQKPRKEETDNRYDYEDVGISHAQEPAEELDEYGDPMGDASALNSTLKEYYQNFDNASRRGISTFDDVSVSAVLRKKFEAASSKGDGGPSSPLRGGGSSGGLGVSKINSPIRSFSPSKSSKGLGLSSSASAVGLSSPNRLNITRNDSFLDRTAAGNPANAATSSLFYSNDHSNPFNETGLAGKLKNSHLEEANNIRIDAAEDKYRAAYNALKERDAVNIGSLEYEVLSKDAEAAQRRWKEFLHNTNRQNYSKLEGTEEYETQYVKDRYGVGGQGSGPMRGGLDERPPVEDDVDEYIGGEHGGVDHHGNDADFNVLYARSIVVQQRWPWTCLVDMKTDKRFYRQEVEDFFQFDPPAEFEEADQEEEERQMFDILEGVGEGNDGTQNKFEITRMKQMRKYRDQHLSIPTAEHAVELVSKFKSELQLRRQLLLQKKKQQNVLDSNMTRSRMRVVGGIIDAKDRVAVSRGKAELNANNGVHSRSPAFLVGKSATYVFRGGYNEFIDEFKEEAREDEHRHHLRDDSTRAAGKRATARLDALNLMDRLKDIKTERKASKNENTAWGEALVFLDRLRRLPNPYLYDVLYGRGATVNPLGNSLLTKSAETEDFMCDAGARQDEGGVGNTFAAQDVTFNTTVNSTFSTTAGITRKFDPATTSKVSEKVFLYRRKDTRAVTPQVIPEVVEYGAARRKQMQFATEQEKLSTAKNIMVNNTKRQLGETRALLSKLHGSVDAKVGDENRSSGVAENEILRRHMLEGVMAHRALLKRPVSRPHPSLVSDNGLFNNLPGYLLIPNALNREELSAALSTPITPGNMNNRPVSSVPMFEVVDYGLWLKYIIFDVAAGQEDMHKPDVDRKGNETRVGSLPIKTVLYANRKTGWVQVGEPFDVKFHRKKAALVEVDRSKLCAFTKVPSKTAPLKLLQDPYGGFLFYCSRRDVYAPGERIGVDMYDNNKVFEHVANINNAVIARNATYKADRSDVFEKLLSRPVDQVSVTATTRTAPTLSYSGDNNNLRSGKASPVREEMEGEEDDEEDDDGGEAPSNKMASVAERMMKFTQGGLPAGSKSASTATAAPSMASRLPAPSSQPPSSFIKAETPNPNSNPSGSPVSTGRHGLPLPTGGAVASHAPALNVSVSGSTDANSPPPSRGAGLASLGRGDSSRGFGLPVRASSMRGVGNMSVASTGSAGNTVTSAKRPLTATITDGMKDAASLLTAGANSVKKRSVDDIKKTEVGKALDKLLQPTESVLWKQLRLLPRVTAEGYVPQEAERLGDPNAELADLEETVDRLCPEVHEPTHRFGKLFPAIWGSQTPLEGIDTDEQRRHDSAQLGFERSMTEQQFAIYYKHMLEISKDPRNVVLLLGLAEFLVALNSNYPALAICGRILDIITSKTYLIQVYGSNNLHVHQLKHGHPPPAPAVDTSCQFNTTDATGHTHGLTQTHSPGRLAHQPLSNHKFYGVYTEVLSLIDLLICKMAGNFLSNYGYSNFITHILDMCPQNAEVIAHVAKIFHQLRFHEQAEQMYLGALLIEPNCVDALRGYALLLLETHGINDSSSEFINRSPGASAAASPETGSASSAIASQRYHLRLAARYLSRIPATASCYYMAKTEIAWITELLDADEDAVKLIYKRVLSQGERNKSTSFALSALARYDHANFYGTVAVASGLRHAAASDTHKSMAKVIDMYHRSLAYCPNNIHALVLLCTCTSNLPFCNSSVGNLDSKFLVGSFSGIAGRRLNTEEIDAYYRRAVYFVNSNCSSKQVRWITLLGYAETLICLLQDMARAEEVLWDATRISVNFDSVWPAVALVQFYLYVRGNTKRAYSVMNWVFHSKRKELLEAVLARREIRRKQHNTTLTGNVNVVHDSHIHQDPSTAKAEISFVSQAEQRLLDEQVAIYLNLAYCELSGTPCNYDTVLKYCEDALLLDDQNTCVHRLLGVVYWKKSVIVNDVGLIARMNKVIVDPNRGNSAEEVEKAEQNWTTSNSQCRKYKLTAIDHFNKACKYSGQLQLPITPPGAERELLEQANNPYTIRQCSVVQALQGNYPQALKLMQLAVAVDCTHAVAWRTLGLMNYIYGCNANSKEANIQIAEESLLYLHKALELSEFADIDAIRYTAQINMELSRYSVAYDMVKRGLKILPGDSTLLMNLGITLSALGHKAPSGMFKVDYKERLESVVMSLEELSVSLDPEEVMEAAVYPDLPGQIKRNNERAAKRLEILSNHGSSTLKSIEVMASLTQNDKGDKRVGQEDAPPEVLYWAGMYYLKALAAYNESVHASSQPGADLLQKAKDLFVRSVQTVESIPHAMSLYMLGWIDEHFNCSGRGVNGPGEVSMREYRRHLASAEKYYCYALQLEPVEPVMYIKLYRLIQDTKRYVQGLCAASEREERVLDKEVNRTVDGHRKKGKKSKKKAAAAATDNRGALKHAKRTDVGPDANTEEVHQQVYEVSNVMRERVLLHERVAKLAQLRAAKLATHIDGLLNNSINRRGIASSGGGGGTGSASIGKFLYLEPFWCEKLFNVLSYEADDWTWMLKSSKTYRTRVNSHS